MLASLYTCYLSNLLCQSLSIDEAGCMYHYQYRPDTPICIDYVHCKPLVDGSVIYTQDRVPIQDVRMPAALSEPRIA